MEPLWKRAPQEARGLLPALAAMGGMVLAVLLLLGCLYLPNSIPALWALPQVQRRFPGAPPARLLLEGCQFWYLMLMLSCALIAVVCLAMGVFVVRRVFFGSGASDARFIQVYLVTLAMLGMVLFSSVALLYLEEIPALFVRTTEDIRALEEGRTEEIVVWLSPKTRPYRLPGPYADGQPTPLTRCAAYGPDTDGMWEDFYFPDELGFTMDPDRLFNENRSIQWNEEYAQRYRLTYTTNFRLVVSAEPAEQGE